MIRAFVRGRSGKILERKWCKDCFSKNHKSVDKKAKQSDEGLDSQENETSSMLQIGAIGNPQQIHHRLFRVKFGKKDGKKAILLSHKCQLRTKGCLILIGRKISFAVIEIWASTSIVVEKEILVKHRRR